MTAAIIGWDVGGAHIKAARVGAPGDWQGALQLERAFALWREPQRLPEVLRNAAASLELSRPMAVTMTAELADCFATKREGVAHVLDAFATAFPGVEIAVYGVDGAFRSVDAAKNAPLDVAAANWMASATLVAEIFPDALWIDVGSTTADIIPIVSGCVAAAGRTDPDRLMSGELIYSGAVRTPVCALVSAVPLRRRRCRIAAEHFAVSGDVHRWLGTISEEGYNFDTPDGRGRSRAEAGARLSRIVCGDSEMLTEAEITRMAQHIADVQVRRLASGIRQVLRSLVTRPPVAVIGGSGRFLARAAAQRAGLPVQESAAEPAVAVAHLLASAHCRA